MSLCDARVHSILIFRIRFHLTSCVCGCHVSILPPAPPSLPPATPPSLPPPSSLLPPSLLSSSLPLPLFPSFTLSLFPPLPLPVSLSLSPSLPHHKAETKSGHLIGQSLEIIVVVSSDRDEAAFASYHKEMPCPASSPSRGALLPL